MIAALAARALAEHMSISDPAYTEEPAGGGAESIPDPVAPQFEEQPEQLGGPDTVAANDALDDQGVER